MAPQTMTVTVGDVVTFTWLFVHNVYLSASEADYNACVRTGGLLLHGSSAAVRGDDSRLPHGDVVAPVVMPSARGPRGAGWKPGGGGASASGIGALCEVALSKPSAARARGDGVLKPGGADRPGGGARPGGALTPDTSACRRCAAVASRPASRRSATVINFKISSSISCPRSVAA